MSGEQRKRKKSSKKKNRQRTKIILIVVELIVLIILAIALYGVSKLNKIQRDDFSPDKVEVNEDIQSETVEKMDQFKTIAVFGLDNRNKKNLSESTKGLSDVILIVTIDNETKEVKMCSVYRDTFLDIGGGSFEKATHAYSKKGKEGAISMLNRNLDLNITEYVTVNFNAVVDCVDLLGGIELEITDLEAELMTGYIQEINELTGHNSKVPKKGGLLRLDGVQATAYARIRYTGHGDFTRAQRQRNVILAMVKEAQQSNLATINAIIDEIFGEISTSFSNAELISLAAQIFDYQITGSAGFPFTKITDTVSKSIGSVVVPCTLESNVIELHKFLYGNEEYVPSTTVINNSSAIIKKTGLDENDAAYYDGL